MNMAESNPHQKLPNLAAHHSKKCEQILPRIRGTQQGHMRGQRQWVRSTKSKKNDKPQIIQTTSEEETESDKLQGEGTRNTQPIKRKVTYSLKSTVQRKQFIPIKLENFPMSRAKGTGT